MPAGYEYLAESPEGEGLRSSAPGELRSLRSRQARAAAATAFGVVGAVIVLLFVTDSGGPEASSLLGSLAASGRSVLQGPSHNQQNIINTGHPDVSALEAVIHDLKQNLPGDIVSDMNFTVSPCDNFYEFVCGGWIANVEIPPDMGAFTKSWDGAASRVKRQMLEMYKASYPESDPAHKLNDWFTACMDTDSVDADGYRPLDPVLSQIDNMESMEELQDLVAMFQSWELPGFMDFDVSASARQSKKHMLFVAGAGLIMPDPSYYPVVYNGTVYGDDHVDDMAAVREYYYKINLYTGLTEEEAWDVANKTLDMETILAQWQADEPDIDDPLGPAPTNITTLINSCPLMPWRRIFEIARDSCAERGYDCGLSVLNGEDKIVFGSPYFFNKLCDRLESQGVKEWIPLLRTHYIYNLAPLLSKDFLNANFELDAALSGVEGMPSRQHKCVRATTGGLSALSDIKYVERYFPKEAEQDGWTILHRMKDAFMKNLANVKWMDDETKKEALLKAEKMELNLGRPPVYYQMHYEVTRDSYFNNSGLAYHCKFLREVLEIDRDVDSKTWNMRASTVNAYYDNGLNALFIPAGIMQKPFYSDEYPLARSFGGIGAIMGHEMTHGFDDTGSQFDENSEMRDWWSQEAKDEFDSRTKCISDLYSGFEIADNQVQGDVTLGENIADFGGLKLAYLAYQDWYNETHGHPPPESEDRLLYVSYGQNWCDKERYLSQRLNMGSDAHSPNPFRTNGVVSQNKWFGGDFHCPKGTPMRPFHKCIMWSDQHQWGETLAARGQKTREVQGAEGVRGARGARAVNMLPSRVQGVQGVAGLGGVKGLESSGLVRRGAEGAEELKVIEAKGAAGEGTKESVKGVVAGARAGGSAKVMKVKCFRCRKNTGRARGFKMPAWRQPQF